MIREEIYLSDKFPTRESLAEALEACEAPDATTTQWIADCPRRAQHAIKDKVFPKDDSYAMMAGRALHAGLATLYSTGDPELSIEDLRVVWGQPADFRLPPGHKYHHLHLGHLEVIFRNYVDWAKRRDTFKPIILQKSDLNLEKVAGAIWRVTDDGRVILGESKIVMEFIVNEEVFLYAGKPDLPIEMGGAYYLMDHKSTNSYLSDWYFDQYRFSNQLRGYCAMTQRLTGLRISGTLINGLYMGSRASSAEFKGDKFARYGPMTFAPAQIAEAIMNQYYWRKLLGVFDGWGYYPQHTSKLCTACPYDTLCALSPAIRSSAMEQDYAQTGTPFLDI